MLIIMPLAILTLCSLTIVLSYLGVSKYSKWAIKKRILDIPNERSSHTEPVPRGGGVVIVALTLGGMFLFQIFGYCTSWAIFLSFITGALVVAGVSWLDDLHSLPVGLRLAGQSLAALMAIAFIGYLPDVTFPVVGKIHLGLLGVPLAFFWIVGMTNAYNFMDGIDGIAAGHAILAGLWWSVLGWILNQPPLMIIGTLLACSSMGFLAHNWSPARVFMGDVGSAFLGYTFAILPLLANLAWVKGENWDGGFLVGILINGPFLVDTIFTFTRRLYHGENVWRAHRTHIYQRLVIAGYSSSFVSLLYMGLSFLSGMAALIWSTFNITS